MLPEHFIDELQVAQEYLGDDRFWTKHFGSLETTSFRQTLDLYEKYHAELTAGQQEQLSKVFWSHIDTRKLPIIEMVAEGDQAQVFFLFRKAEDNGKDLYLQGDVHGYGSTLDSQRLQRQGDTDILCCENSIPNNALVTYQYVEVTDNPEHPIYRNKMPNDEQLKGVMSDPFPDPYQKHAHPYYASGFFCTNANNDVSHLGSSPVDWPTLISGAYTHLVSGKGGEVSPFPHTVSDNYMGQLFGPDCAEFRRIMHVFAPPGKLDQLVIINDGPGYLLVNTAERIEKLKQTGVISEQCAVVFVGTLPGLEKDHELVSELSKMQGMGIRTIDYLDHVDEYVEFITKQLLPYLEEQGIELPHDPITASVDPTKVTVIGSSMSGTASLYMGLRYPKHFGNVIAQSPSPANRQLIENLDHLSDRARRINIDLSCGAFEDATKYAKIGNLEFMNSLETSLGVKGHAGLHGHELPAWSHDLERSLPALYNLSQILDQSQALLKKQFGTPVAIISYDVLSEPERRNVILRIHLSSDSDAVPHSVILKQSKPANAQDKETDARFARDWAGLEFSNHRQPGTHHVPQFYGADPDSRFILLEDLGEKHVSLVDSLLASNEQQAILALERYMTAVGRFHAASFGYTGAYQQTLAHIHEQAKTPEQDLAICRQAWQAGFAKRDVSLTSEVSAEIENVLAGIYLPGPFTVLAHGDLAPDNVFDHREAQELQLLDFEWSFVRNALLDGTYLRMCIPTGWCAKAIPEQVLEPLEQRYRQALQNTIPAAADDVAYHTAYTQACAFHAVQELAHMHHLMEKDSTWGPLLENNSGRSRVLSRLQAFVDMAEKHNQLPHLKGMVQQTLVALQTLWPEAKPLAYYPAFTPHLSKDRHDTVRGIISSTSTPADYPRAMQNNMMTPPASAMHRAHGSTAIHITHHTLREAVVILPKNNNKLEI